MVYVTDTTEGAVYELSTHTDALRKIAPGHTFTAANGIAISPDGLDVIEVGSGSYCEV